MPEISKSKYLVQASWEDAPHLDDDEKAMLLESTPPYLRDARSKGIPTLGAGAIYPISEDEILVDPFEIPNYWPRSFGFDVGWNRTAAIWGAIDRTSGQKFLYSEYYRGEAEPVVHAQGISARGKWIPGAVDPAARGRGQTDGKKLYQMYYDLGLDLAQADNAVEAGIYQVWEWLSTGELKVFNTLKNWLAEYRLYHRDEKGRVVKEHDHLMDATRYWCMTGVNIAIVEPKPRKDFANRNRDANKHTGY